MARSKPRQRRIPRNGDAAVEHAGEQPATCSAPFSKIPARWRARLVAIAALATVRTPDDGNVLLTTDQFLHWHHLCPGAGFACRPEPALGNARRGTKDESPQAATEG